MTATTSSLVSPPRVSGRVETPQSSISTLSEGHIETPTATGLYLGGHDEEVDRHVVEGGVSDASSTERKHAETIQKLHYKLQMQKTHYENKMANMKIQIKELESEVKVYVGNLTEKNKTLRHLEAVSEARNITISVFEKQTTEVMRFMREVDPDLQHCIDRLMEYQKQIAENPQLVHKLPTARDVAIEYKQKRLENMQRRSSLEKSAFGQLHALPAKKARKPSIAPETALVKPPYQDEKVEAREDLSHKKSDRIQKGHVQKAFGQTKSVSSPAGSPRGKHSASFWSLRTANGSDERGEASREGPFSPLSHQEESLCREESVSAQISPKASFRVIVPDSKQAELHRDKGAKTLGIQPAKSFQGRRHTQSVATMHLEAFIDYSEMEEVNRTREKLKATEIQHQREISQVEAENATLKNKLRATESKLSDMKIREGALRHDFDKLIARTLSTGPTTNGMHRGLSGAQTARTSSQTKGFEMPHLRGTPKGAPSFGKTETLETLNTPRLPEISTKIKAKRQMGTEASISPPSRSLKKDEMGYESPSSHEPISLVPTKRGVLPMQKKKEREVAVHEDSSFVAVTSVEQQSKSSKDVKTSPTAGGLAHDDLAINASASIVSLENATERKHKRTEEEENKIDGYAAAERTVEEPDSCELVVPKALPNAPWVPSSTAHVDTTKTAPAFRILLSCYVHDLCSLVRIIQPAQDTLFKESRELQEYMLALWNGSTDAICPATNVDLNILNLQEIIPSFSNNPVVKQLGKLSERKNPSDIWTEEVDLLILSWKSLTGSLQQIIAHFQQQIGLWRKTQLMMWTKNKGIPRNLVKPTVPPKKEKTSSPQQETFDEDQSSSISGWKERK